MKLRLAKSVSRALAGAWHSLDNAWRFISIVIKFVFFVWIVLSSLIYCKSICSKKIFNRERLTIYVLPVKLKCFVFWAVGVVMLEDNIFIYCDNPRWTRSVPQLIMQWSIIWKSLFPHQPPHPSQKKFNSGPLYCQDKIIFNKAKFKYVRFSQPLRIKGKGSFFYCFSILSK